MARKKRSNISAENAWMREFEIPGLKAVKAVQRSIDKLRPPGIDSFIDATKIVERLFPPVDPTFTQFKTIDIPVLDWFKEFHATQDNLQKVIDRVHNFRSPFTDFEYEHEDDLEATAFELLPPPEIILPEQKIVLARKVTQIEKIIASIYKDNKALHQIHHREFEEMIAELLKSKGFDVHLTKQTRDGGTDIIALQDVAGSPMKFLVECKRYAPTRKIGVDIIRSFSHVINTQKANKGMIFTTSYFTADAQKEQQIYMPYLLDLKDQDDVLTWVKKYVE